nr:MAG TPA: hypothetical protein [Caudoviricetes sp.]
MITDISYVFEDLKISAKRVGYHMHVTKSPNSKYPNLSMNLSDPSESAIMPEINIVTILDPTGNWCYFKPTIKFPVLTTTADDFADNIAYIISEKWAEIGRFITELNNFEYYATEE